MGYENGKYLRPNISSKAGVGGRAALGPHRAWATVLTSIVLKLAGLVSQPVPAGRQQPSGSWVSIKRGFYKQAQPVPWPGATPSLHSRFSRVLGEWRSCLKILFLIRALWA